MQVYGNYNQEKIITEQTKKNCKNIYALHIQCEDITNIYSSFEYLIYQLSYQMDMVSQN